MRDLNHVVLVGRLTRDPEMKYTKNNLPIMNFAIANNDSYNKNGERVETTNFFDVEVWANLAMAIQPILYKGTQVIVEGKLKQNRWTSQEGKTLSRVTITANNIQIIKAKDS